VKSKKAKHKEIATLARKSRKEYPKLGCTNTSPYFSVALLTEPQTCKPQESALPPNKKLKMTPPSSEAEVDSALKSFIKTDEWCSFLKRNDLVLLNPTSFQDSEMELLCPLASLHPEKLISLLMATQEESLFSLFSPSSCLSDFFVNLAQELFKKFCFLLLVFFSFLFFSFSQLSFLQD
jgi:hypothetical protein